MKTRNNIEVLVTEKTMEHMAAHAGVDANLIAEAVAKLDYVGPFFIETVDLGRVIGKSSCVTVGPEDKVAHYYRKNRAGKTPFVGKEPEDTSCITIGICDDRDNDGAPTLFTAFYGVKAPREPWDAKSPEEEEESRKFWSTHALSYDRSAIDWEREEAEKRELMDRDLFFTKLKEAGFIDEGANTFYDVYKAIVDACNDAAILGYGMSKAQRELSHYRETAIRFGSLYAPAADLSKTRSGSSRLATGNAITEG